MPIITILFGSFRNFFIFIFHKKLLIIQFKSKHFDINKNDQKHQMFLKMKSFPSKFKGSKQLLFIQINVAFYNYYKTTKQLMFFDYQFYVPIQTSPFITNVSIIQSIELFQIISKVLNRNFKVYKQQNANLKSEVTEIVRWPQSEGEKDENLTNSLSKKQQVFFEKMEVQKKQKLIQSNDSIQVITVDGNPKQLSIKGKEIDGWLLTSSELSKEQNLKENEEFDEVFFQPKNNKTTQQNFQFNEFAIECPKMGIKTAQILSKKELLIQRTVLNWGEVSQKGPKQRREIRMLAN